MNCRQQIRAAAAALIGTGTAAQDRVYPGRLWPLSPENLPCITIHTPNETVRAANLGKGEEHTVRLAVTVFAADTAALPVNDALDGISTSVSAALTEPKLGLPILDVNFAGSKLDNVSLGDTASGALSLFWDVRYRTAFGVHDQFA